MAYIGKDPAEAYQSFVKQDFSVSATTSYTLSQAVNNENEIALFINFVRQEPTTAYTASGTSLTLTSATASGDDMYCVYLGMAKQTVNPSDGSVGSSQVASTIITGQTAETSIATDDTVLIHDTSAGALRKMTRANFVSGVGETNTPVFLASKSDSNQSIAHNTTTKVTFNNEIVDSDNAFASSTFTVPSGEGGTYVFHTCIYVGNSQDYNYLSIRKNGNTTNVINMTHFRNTTSDSSYNISGLVSASAGDTFEVYYAQSKGSAVNVESNSSVGFTFFGGFKVN